MATRCLYSSRTVTTMIRLYQVHVQARKVGAIGRFTGRFYRVEAENEEQARATAFAYAYDDGLEHVLTKRVSVLGDVAR